MSAPHYTDFHPRWYRHRVSTYWWLRKWVYVKFILRELSSLAVAWFVILTLLQISAIERGRQSYELFQAWLLHPLVLLVNLVALAFVIFHAVTWFNLAPSAMQVRLGGRRLPNALVAAPNYVAWLAITAFVAWFVLRRSP